MVEGRVGGEGGAEVNRQLLLQGKASGAPHCPPATGLLPN